MPKGLPTAHVSTDTDTIYRKLSKEQNDLDKLLLCHEIEYKGLTLCTVLIALLRIAAASNPKRGSLFNFSLGFGAELESTQQDIKAKEDAMKASPISSMAVREHQQSVAEHVVNDEEQWKKFREQMRSGGSKTGMQLKHNLDSLLQTRAQELKTTGADTNFRQRLVRRASIKDFASSLIRGEDRQNRRGSVAVFASISEEAQTNAPASNRTPPRRQNSSSYNGSPRA
jgi:hypothetical protein